MKKSSINSLLEGPIFPAVISYSIPIILSSLLQLLFNAADLIVVGRYCGSIFLAAVGATSSLINLLVNFFIGMSVGCGVSVAQAIGAKDNSTVHKTVHTAIPISIICGVILSIIGITFCKKFLTLIGTPSEVLPLSTKYMKIYFAGTIFVMLYNFAASILRAAGDTKSPLISLIIAGIANVIFNLIFVTVFDMNVAGVALATIISQAISAILVIITLLRREDSCKLFIKELRIYKNEFFKIFRIGLPAGIQSSLFGLSNVIIQSSINSFGQTFLSGNSAAGNIEGFIYVIMNAFHHVALNFIGQNFGAKNYQRIKNVFYASIVCVTASGLFFGSLAFIFGRQLLSIYITDSPEAIAAGITRMAFLCLPYFLCGILDVINGALRGIGSSLVPMIISILGVCVFRVVWIFTIFDKIHTPECLFSSYTISWILTGVIEAVMFFIILKKHIHNESKA